jgi:hypothetical protein
MKAWDSDPCAGLPDVNSLCVTVSSCDGYEQSTSNTTTRLRPAGTQAAHANVTWLAGSVPDESGLWTSVLA